METLRKLCFVVWFCAAATVYCFCCIVNKKEPAKEIYIAEPEEILYIEEPLPEIKEETAEEKMSNAVFESSGKYGVPVNVILAIIATESNTNGTSKITKENIFDVNHEARSSAECVGLMQISKYALAEYNKANETEYNLEELYDIYLNVEVGTWYFSQLSRLANGWVEQYVIYNVGYGEFNKVNCNSFYNWNGELDSEYRNRYFYMNDLMPPSDSEHGMYGENMLPDYNAKKRFEICLKICNEFLLTYKNS